MVLELLKTKIVGIAYKRASIIVKDPHKASTAEI